MYLCEHGTLGTRYALGTIFIPVIVLASCRGNDAVILHPTPENIQEVSDPQFVLREDTSVQWLDLSSLNGVFVGVAEGTHLQMIGDVSDLDISVDKMLYADYIYGHVREYDLDGNLTEVIGKRGEGPGEFPRVRFVEVAGIGKDSYLVVGASGSRVVVFKEKNGVWELFGSFATSYSFLNGGLCVMDGHIYSIGYVEEYTGVVHKHTFEGEYVLSFGRLYSDPLPIVRRVLGGRGSLDCNEESGVIAYVNSLSSVVTGFSDTGDMRWQVQLSDVNPTPSAQRLREDGRTSVQMTYWGASVGYGGSIEHTTEIEFIPGPDPQSFVLTYYSPVPGEAEGWDKQHIFRVEAESGYGFYLGSHTLLTHDNEELYVKGFDSLQVYAIRYKPYPQIGLFRYSDMLP